MSRKSQQPPAETDMNAEHQHGPSKEVRLQAILELVRSDRYHIPAMLVAERMIERATTEGHDPGR